jgi:hypothetical protein
VEPPRAPMPWVTPDADAPAWRAIAAHQVGWAEFEASVRSVANIARLEVVGDRLMVEDLRGHAVSVDRASAGVSKVIDVLGRAHAPNLPPLLAIDEIENHVHADMAGRLVDALRGMARRTQIVVTTHSGRILQNMHASEVLWVRGGPSGSEIVPVLDDPTLARLLEHRDLAELALGGYFGAQL